MSSQVPGWGIHFYMGSRLAEMQLRIARVSTMHRFRQVEVVGELKQVRVRFMKNFEHLTARVHPW